MSPTPLPVQTIHPPPITVVLTVVLLIFFLLGFFSIYFCRCIVDSVFHTWNLRRGPSGRLAAGGLSGVNPSHTGLDPALIKALPTFLYSTVKDARREKYALECAICLVEFSGDSFLRLLTACYHVFHQECIDLWLASHKTCPVCRRNLDTPHLFDPKSPPVGPDTMTPAESAVQIESDGEESIVSVGEEEERHRRRQERMRRQQSSDERPRGKRDEAARFARSHSTGHSIVRVNWEDGDEDRYTLRLPAQVRVQILRARHWTGSCEALAGEWDRHFARIRYYSSSDYMGVDEFDSRFLGSYPV